MTDPSDPDRDSHRDPNRDPHRDLGGVLHDVSNALTVLLGWVGEARAPDATPESIAYALTIVEQRARIARDLARHAIGSPRFDEQRDLASIVDEVVQALKVEAQRAGAKIVATGAGGSHGSHASHGAAKVAGALDVSQVLTNLVLNAIAYTPAGGTVEVAVEIDDEQVVVVVADEGPGVAPERREGVFRGDSLRPGGVGIGLRHSRALARAWGGDVEIIAGDGGKGGGRFRVSWPRVDAIPRPPTSTSRVAVLAGLRVLVIEDDAAVTQLLEAALEARGASVTIAGTMDELTSALARGPYDAVLVDLSPIAADPAGSLDKLRETCPGAKVVLVTGSADALPDAVDISTLGLVRKPFEVNEVLAVLRP